MVQKLSEEFGSEIKSKQDTFDLTQAHLRAATRQLAEQRKQITKLQQRCGELDQASQRARNLEKAIATEDEFDWTTIGKQAEANRLNVQEAPPVPQENTPEALLQLRKMKLHQDRVRKILEERCQGLQGVTAEKEFQCKKIVAMCTGIPLDRVEEVSAIRLLLNAKHNAQIHLICRCWRILLLLWKVRHKDLTSDVSPASCRR